MTPTPTQIIAEVARHFGIDVDEVMTSRARRAPFPVARAVAANVMRRLRPMSQPEIAKAIGLKSHSAVNAMLRSEMPWPEVLAVERALANRYVERRPLENPAPRAITADEVLRVLNESAEVRERVMSHLRAAIIGQIVADASRSQP